MTITKTFRLYAVTINDKTTRELAVPEYELGVIKAAWRGTPISFAPMDETRDVIADPVQVYRTLQGRYNSQSVVSFYPGPERLEEDMDRAESKTLKWLDDRKKAEDAARAAARAAWRIAATKTKAA